MGEEPALEIMSVWIFRGKTVPQEMLDNPQWEYYKTRVLDYKNEADLKLVGEFLSAKAGDIVNGLTV